uniref:Membrane protein BRI3 n=1 Tax=Ditylenchus dipsaci TaxID=166011 RepID=A0A915CYT5_9BILA
MKECPVCHKPLKEKFTWRGILWAIFCFPCGMFCCFRRRTLRCKTCDFEVIISDGSIPRVARAYKSYNLFKWQFSFRRNFSNSNQSAAVDTQTPETMKDNKLKLRLTILKNLGIKTRFTSCNLH